MVQPIPEGYHTVTPYLMLPDVAETLRFLGEAFDAEERLRLKRPDGSIMHAETRVGDSRIMMGEPMAPFGPMPASICLYVEDCDALYARALAAGGESIMEPATIDHSGERYGGVKDANGNLWWITTHVEDVSAEESQRRINALKGRP